MEIEKELLEEIKKIEKNTLDKSKHDEILKKLEEIQNPAITKDDIIQEKDPQKRVNLIRENMHLFK